ncbi:hypothetical protein CDAR_203871 [Caerostris darwini]|uniref:Uncharacterized protein n=1 Tax=Caerostris darwini TaxID=1538125 RepID=A0AAV4PB93_9ARAC|nr:hypothetical protein CDAR_203871 [Caerostris darwini]
MYRYSTNTSMRNLYCQSVLWEITPIRETIPTFAIPKVPKCRCGCRLGIIKWSPLSLSEIDGSFGLILEKALTFSQKNHSLMVFQEHVPVYLDTQFRGMKRYRKFFRGNQT